ncbi:hyaluronoglucosaminidase 6 [Callorhinchus milii]|uniref:Hyaluronidase n=1 Tax=Callorhinchus milii TaxID=7868 RepID=V9KHR2_CALMI|nr:hyaluronoglucosaminidase 6 [Callorhinchus milii]|eukprot:gi/632961420/ref/XP_007896746.1/ PREDICTED: hyaluronidase-4-like [Callorhinchus milii]
MKPEAPLSLQRTSRHSFLEDKEFTANGNCTMSSTCIPRKMFTKQLSSATALLIVLQIACGQEFKQAKVPVLPYKPFIVVWNAPTEQCRLRYKVDLDLSIFDIASNSNETLSGSNITIFYHNQLGYYPYFTDSKTPVNGGIPQNKSLQDHLNKAKSDIEKSIPRKDFGGLGVIDWENWRPQWIRNWGHKNIYRKKSIGIERTLHPNWTEKKIKSEAKKKFENAGRNFLNATLNLAEKTRPKGLWGFYLFPDCYNHNYKTHPNKYNGKCPQIEHKRNDKLLWLWRESTALFPSIYLERQLKSSPKALKFVHYRVKEAMRIASMARSDYDLPVFVYARPFYAYRFEVLTKIDLVHTIGESAAMGAAGIVLWGNIDYARSKNHCLKVKKYIDGPLGHYVVNVTTATKLCSKTLCENHGRCVRKISDSRVFLHLSPSTFEIRTNADGVHPRFYVQGKLQSEDMKALKQSFACQCYQGWTGIACEVPLPEDPSAVKSDISLSEKASSAPPLPLLLFTLVAFLLVVQNLNF